MNNKMNIRETIKYLLSNSFQEYAEKLTNAYIGGPKIKYVMEHPTICPRTDGDTIWYDSAPMSYINTIYEKYKDIDTLDYIVCCILADLFHEKGHTTKSILPIMAAINKGSYVKTNVIEKFHVLLDEICEYSKTLTPFERKALADLYNVVDDSGMENAIKKENTFVKRCIILSNAILFTKTKSLETLVKEKASSYDVLFHACMDYAIIGATKGRIPDEYRKIFITELMPLLNAGKNGEDGFIRFDITKKIFEVLLPYLKECEKEAANKNEDYQSNYPKSPAMDTGDSSENSSQYMPVSQQTRQRANTLNGEKQESESSSSNKTSENIDNQDSSKEKGCKGGEKQEDKSSLDSKTSENTNNQNSSKEKGCKDETDTFEMSEDDFGNAGMSDDEFSAAMQDIKNSLKKVDKEYRASKIAEEQADEEEMENLKIKINYPNELHASCRPNQVLSYVKVKDKDMYKAIVKENKRIIETFVKAIQVDKANRKEKTRYTIHGALAQEKLYKVSLSQKTYKKTIPAKHVDKCCVVVMLDLSGSMKGERLQQAIAGTIILIEACEELGIPIAVVGHNADYPTFNFYWFKRFESLTDKYSITKAKAGNCNRDGLALLYGAEILKRRAEQVKILLHITDGQPSDTGYSGAPAKKDMLEIEKSLEKKHIRVCGVAISGNQVENDAIGQCYKKYISVTDLKSLGKDLLHYIKPML